MIKDRHKYKQNNEIYAYRLIEQNKNERKQEKTVQVRRREWCETQTNKKPKLKNIYKCANIIFILSTVSVNCVSVCVCVYVRVCK